MHAIGRGGPARDFTIVAERGPSLAGFRQIVGERGPSLAGFRQYLSEGLAQPHAIGLAFTLRRERIGSSKRSFRTAYAKPIGEHDIHGFRAAT